MLKKMSRIKGILLAAVLILLFAGMGVSASAKSEREETTYEKKLVYYDIKTKKETPLSKSDLKREFSIDIDAENSSIISKPQKAAKEISSKKLTPEEKSKLINANKEASPLFPFSFPILPQVNAAAIPDIRTPVSNPNSFPYYCVAKIYGEHDQWLGTGFAVGKRLLATARHCIDKDANGNFHNTVTAYFGYDLNQSIYSYRTSDLAGYIYYPTVSSHLDDWIFLVWGSDTVQNTGCFGMDGAGRNQLGVSTAGYPQDLQDGNRMYKCSGVITACRSWDFTCSLRASHGQSGSPVYYNTSGGPYAIGILTSAVIGSNIVDARRIDSGLVGWLRDSGHA